MILGTHRRALPVRVSRVRAKYVQACACLFVRTSVFACTYIYTYVYTQHVAGLASGYHSILSEMDGGPQLIQAQQRRCDELLEEERERARVRTQLSLVACVLASRLGGRMIPSMPLVCVRACISVQQHIRLAHASELREGKRASTRIQTQLCTRLCVHVQAQPICKQTHTHDALRRGNNAFVSAQLPAWMRSSVSRTTATSCSRARNTASLQPSTQRP